MDTPADPAAVTRLRCVLIPRFNMLGLNGILEPPRIANYLSQDPLYQTTFHSFDGDVITSSNGLKVDCDAAPEMLDRNDIVLIFGSWGSEHYRNPKLISWLRLQARRNVRICGIELGAYVLARTGLLARQRVTTHWSCLSGFQERFSDLVAVEQLYTDNGRFMTCAGGTAGLDMMLHLIAQAHGKRLAGEISDQLLHHPIRAEDTPQRMTLGRGTESLPTAVRKTVSLIEDNINEPLKVPEIAQEVGLSQRQLERLFVKEMGCSVVQFGLLMRLQHARVLLISTGLSIREIATASGFNSLSHFAYAFKDCFGKRPRDYRQAWPEQEIEPHWPGTLATFLDTIRAKRRVERQASDGLT